MAAQHAGYFVQARIGRERANRAAGNGLVGRSGLFADQVMVVGAGRYLCQVCNGQHLAALAKLAHEAAHFVRHGAAHTGVYLVKNQGGRLLQQAAGNGNGQRNARQLAARGNLGNGARGRACMPGYQ